MAKSIYICSRNGFPEDIGNSLINICEELAPDNIVPRTPKILVNQNTALAIMNPTESNLVHDSSLLMGMAFSSKDKWFEPKADYPEGSFALFRNSQEFVEIVTDSSASRTIWYYFNDDIFISATSQRAIIMFMGSFEFNEKVIPWMLSTGSLGPDLSWDKRLKIVPPESSVILDKHNWTISEKSNKIEFNTVKLSDDEHRKNLTNILRNNFNKLDLNYSKWFLPLSGGYDSRGILCLLGKTQRGVKDLKTITWGLESSLEIKETDASVAKKLSEFFGVSHQFYKTDVSREPLNTIFDRFIKLGEGRTDHLAGYMDGFYIWKTLFENGVEGIIRGDEGFGWNEVSSELYVRLCTGLNLCSDFGNLKEYRKYGFAEQHVPEKLVLRKEESLFQWRDRIYHEYRLPTIIAALTDLKLAYVEQISPLLAKNVLRNVRELPDHLRTNKKLFKEIVDEFGLNIRYASESAIAKPKDILKTSEATMVLRNLLLSEDAKKIFPSDFLDLVLNKLKSNPIPKEGKRMNSRKNIISTFMPNFLKNIIRKHIIPPNLDYNIIAFRIFLICKMHSLLLQDSKLNND